MNSEPAFFRVHVSPRVTAANAVRTNAKPVPQQSTEAAKRIASESCSLEVTALLLLGRLRQPLPWSFCQLELKITSTCQAQGFFDDVRVLRLASSIPGLWTFHVAAFVNRPYSMLQLACRSHGVVDSQQGAKKPVSCPCSADVSIFSGIGSKLHLVAW